MRRRREEWIGVLPQPLAVPAAAAAFAPRPFLSSPQLPAVLLQQVGVAAALRGQLHLLGGWVELAVVVHDPVQQVEAGAPGRELFPHGLNELVGGLDHPRPLRPGQVDERTLLLPAHVVPAQPKGALDHAQRRRQPAQLI